jgi:hypothetical protein
MAKIERKQTKSNKKYRERRPNKKEGRNFTIKQNFFPGKTSAP